MYNELYTRQKLCTNVMKYESLFYTLIFMVDQSQTPARHAATQVARYGLGRRSAAFPFPNPSHVRRPRGGIHSPLDREGRRHLSRTLVYMTPTVSLFSDHTGPQTPMPRAELWPPYCEPYIEQPESSELAVKYWFRTAVGGLVRRRTVPLRVRLPESVLHP